MASIRNLKKDINYVLGDIIENVYLWEQTSNGGKQSKESEAIVDDAITTFDELMLRINNRPVDNRRDYFKKIKNDLEEKGRQLIERINKLN